MTRNRTNEVKVSGEEWKLDDDLSMQVLSRGSVEYLRLIPEFERFVPQTHGRYLEAPLLQVMAQCREQYSIEECFYGVLPLPTTLLSLRSALRLHNPVSSGDPSFTAVFGVLSTPLPLLESHYVIPEGHSTLSYPPIYELTADEWDVFKFSWKIILDLYQSDQDSQFILKALNWFESGRACSRHEDRIIHHFIGLESLFGQREDWPSKDFLPRVSYLLNFSEVNRNARFYKDLKRAYKIRNEIVHGDRIASDDFEKRLGLAAACDFLDDVFRTSLQMIIALHGPLLESSKEFITKEQFVRSLDRGINGDEKALSMWRGIWRLFR